MILEIIFAIFMLMGLVGIILPIFPGVPFMWILALLYGAVGRFSDLSLAEFGILSVLMGSSILVDYLSGLLGAKLGGASLRSLGIGMLGLLVGMVILPPLGGLVGMFLGVLASEIYNYQDPHKALRAASGGVIGSLVGILTNLGIGIGFIALFLKSTL